MEVMELKTPIKTSVPAQYLGYSLQQVRLCYHLLRAPDQDSVSLEYLDDVAIHRADGSVVLEQCKSALTGNPASDKSEDLWKTFGNWADLCVAGSVPVDRTDFRYYVTPAKTGKLIVALHEATSADAIKAVLGTVKKLIKASDLLIGCGPHVTRFLAAGDETCAKIIERFEFVAQTEPIDSIKEQMRLLPPETIESFCSAAIGAAASKVDKLIREKKIPIISASAFMQDFRAFVQKYNFANLLHSKVPTPSTDAISAVVNTAPLFVRQLEAIEAKPDMLVTAVSDFLRTTSDKVHWADEGVVLSDSFDELDAQLERQHKIVTDEIEDVHSNMPEAARGRAIYRKCGQTSMPLEGRVLPSHFIPGAFNCLAEARRLGWHPNYLTLFPGD